MTISNLEKNSTDENLQDENRQEVEQTPWASARVRNRLDLEAMVLLRSNLDEPINKAKCWPSLRDLLRNKGFDMHPREGRLRLVDLHSRVEICTFGVLGYPRVHLEERFGGFPNFH